ncbi:MAG: AAA family ATPase [Vicinamibacterales bacterium]
MPPDCVILIGLPASGKSTFYRRRFSGTHTHISKDLFPSGARAKESRQRTQLDTELAAGRSVVVDNTNVTRGERAAIIQTARGAGARVTGYYLPATTREAVARNEAREGRSKVPKVAIFTRAKQLVPPSLDEGFDELHVLRMTDDGDFVEQR